MQGFFSKGNWPTILNQPVHMTSLAAENYTAPSNIVLVASNGVYCFGNGHGEKFSRSVRFKSNDTKRPLALVSIIFKKKNNSMLLWNLL